MGFLRYPEYKDSGMLWMGEVPSHWKPLPVRACYETGKTPNTGLQETTVLSLSYGSIIVKPGDINHGLVPASFETYQIIEPDDIVIRPTDLQNDWRSKRVGIARQRGVITSAYMRLRTTEKLTSDYGYAYLNNCDLRKVFYGLGSGVRQNLSWDDLKYLPVFVPPMEEQEAIMHFLDQETSKIDALVAEQQRLIELLKEKRQAVISHAVTKGLNPNAPMKPSGIPWLGDVPEHWQVTTIKHLCKEITDGAHISPETDGGVYDFVSTKDIDGETIDFENCLKTSPSNYEYLLKTGCKPFAGDVLFSKDGTIGRTIVVSEERDFVVASSLIILRLDGDAIDSNFTHFLCQSHVIQSQVDRYVRGAGLPRLSITNLKKVVGCFPPVSEQIEIAIHLSDACNRYESLIAEAHTAIACLQERRTALISAAVTGKIDVRNAVPEAASA